MEMLSWKDFQKVEMHTGTVIAAKPFPEARKPAYKLTIDFGPLGIKQSSAQITDKYKLESLMGIQVIAVTNFPPKQIANFHSECLVLGAVGANNEVTLLSPESIVPNGLRIG